MTKIQNKDLSKNILTVIAGLILLSGVVSFTIAGPSMIRRVPFSAPEASYQNWDDILQNPQQITLDTYTTGINETTLSGIVNLEHENAQGLVDGIIDIPVLVGVIQHDEFGAHLIDAGLDASYVDNPHGTIKGLIVDSFLANGSQEPGQHIAAILDRESIQIQTVWLTHLHPDHTAGIVDLPKDVPYVAGKGERYVNFRFIIQTEHLAGIDQLYEINLSDGIDLPPFGKGIDLFGDGSFWAIDSSGHSKGHILFFINGVDEQIMFTGDAINIGLQFEKSIGSGTYSSDLEKSQEVVEQIIVFKELYPEVKLVFGHDLETF